MKRASAPSSVPGGAATQEALKAQEQSSQPPVPKGRPKARKLPISTSPAKALRIPSRGPSAPLGSLTLSRTPSVRSVSENERDGARRIGNELFFPQRSIAAAARAMAEGSTISEPNSAADEPSSDTPNDPNDPTFGEKTKRKSTAVLTNTAGRRAAVGGRKRDSDADEPAPARKRTRLSLDG